MDDSYINSLLTHENEERSAKNSSFTIQLSVVYICI